MTVSTTTDTAFEREVLSSESPVLVEFTAAWCPPCRMIAPVLDEIANDYAEQLRVVSLDVDANPVTARRYQVMGLPTLALFVGGEVVSQTVGARPRSAILKEIEPHLARDRAASASGIG
jgi:thioredoxin 1